MAVQTVDDLESLLSFGPMKNLHFRGGQQPMSDVDPLSGNEMRMIYFRGHYYNTQLDCNYRVQSMSSNAYIRNDNNQQILNQFTNSLNPELSSNETEEKTPRDELPILPAQEVESVLHNLGIDPFSEKEGQPVNITSYITESDGKTYESSATNKCFVTPRLESLEIKGLKKQTTMNEPVDVSTHTVRPLQQENMSQIRAPCLGADQYLPNFASLLGSVNKSKLLQERSNINISQPSTSKRANKTCYNNQFQLDSENNSKGCSTLTTDHQAERAPVTYFPPPKPLLQEYMVESTKEEQLRTKRDTTLCNSYKLPLQNHTPNMQLDGDYRLQNKHSNIQAPGNPPSQLMRDMINSLQPVSYPSEGFCPMGFDTLAATVEKPMDLPCYTVESSQEEQLRTTTDTGSNIYKLPMQNQTPNMQPDLNYLLQSRHSNIQTPGNPPNQPMMDMNNSSQPVLYSSEGFRPMGLDTLSATGETSINLTSNINEGSSMQNLCCPARIDEQYSNIQLENIPDSNTINGNGRTNLNLHKESITVKEKKTSESVKNSLGTNENKKPSTTAQKREKYQNLINELKTKNTSLKTTLAELKKKCDYDKDFLFFIFRFACKKNYLKQLMEDFIAEKPEERHNRAKHMADMLRVRRLQPVTAEMNHSVIYRRS